MAVLIITAAMTAEAATAEAAVAEEASAAAEQDEAFNETGVSTESDYLAV